MSRDFHFHSHGRLQSDFPACYSCFECLQRSVRLGRALPACSLSLSSHRTFDYCAPEILLGRGATPASDIWSLGILLFRMLSGEGEGKRAVRHCHVQDCPADLQMTPSSSLPVCDRAMRRAGERPRRGQVRQLHVPEEAPQVVADMQHR